MRTVKPLNSDFQKGVFITSFYYLAGVLLAWISYLVLGENHDLGFHYVVAFLWVTMGLTWAVSNIVYMKKNAKNQVNKGSLLTNLIVLIPIIVIAALLITM